MRHCLGRLKAYSEKLKGDVVRRRRSWMHRHKGVYGADEE